MVNTSWLIAWFGRRGIYYGWVIVAVMFVTLFISLGFRFAFGVFYSAILDETGWRRAETAGVVSAAMIVYACTAALSGYLFDRLGARVLFPIGALCMGAGLMLCSTSESLAGLTVSYGILLGFSYAALGFIPHMAIVPRWFVRRRGLASAASLAGVGLGSLGVAALSAELIVRIGWRETMWWFGIASMVVLIPINVLFHRHSAEHIGLVPDGPSAQPAARTAPARTGATIGDAVRSPAFWLLALAVTMTGLCNMTIVVHQTRMLVDMGYSLPLASLIFGMLGVMRAVGGLIWGPLSDRIGRSACVVIICGISLVGLALLWLTSLVPAESSALRIALLVGLPADVRHRLQRASPRSTPPPSPTGSRAGTSARSSGCSTWASAWARRWAPGGRAGCSTVTAVTTASSSGSRWAWCSPASGWRPRRGDGSNLTRLPGAIRVLSNGY